MMATGSSFSYAYMPEVMTGYTNRMNFFQRVVNLIHSASAHVAISLTVLSAFKKMAREVGLENTVNPFYGYTDFDLYLSNIHFSSDFPLPMVPNMIPVGGLTTRQLLPWKR